MSLAICVVLINLLLTNTSSKHLIVRFIINLPDPSFYALKISGHVDLPVRI
jgi:hypothetical protein